jgi:hypothetical protein
VRGELGELCRSEAERKEVGPRGKKHAEEAEPLGRATRALVFMYQILFSSSFFLGVEILE